MKIMKRVLFNLYLDIENEKFKTSFNVYIINFIDLNQFIKIIMNLLILLNNIKYH